MICGCFHLSTSICSWYYTHLSSHLCELWLDHQLMIHSPVHLYELSTAAASPAAPVPDAASLQHVSDAGVQLQDFASTHSILCSATDTSEPAQPCCTHKSHNVRAVAGTRVPVRYPGNLIFYYPTLPGYPNSKNYRVCPYNICSTKAHTFSFNNCLYLYSGVEFVSNQKMTIQSHYQRKFVNGDVTQCNTVSFWWHRETHIYGTISIKYLSPGTWVPDKLPDRVLR